MSRERKRTQKENRREGCKESPTKSCVALPKSYFSFFSTRSIVMGVCCCKTNLWQSGQDKQSFHDSKKNLCPVTQPPLALEAEYNTRNFIQISAVSRQ